MKEVTARIKINQLLVAAGWCVDATKYGLSIIALKPSVALKSTDFDQFGESLRYIRKSFADFLLIEAKSSLPIVLWAQKRAQDSAGSPAVATGAP
jgi:hypothetical protein